MFPKTFSYHEQLILPKSSQSHYLIAEKLGYGKYSDVFKGYQRDDQGNISETPIVIKVLKPVRIPKVYREVKILTDVISGPFIMKLQDVVEVEGSQYPAFIMEYGGESF